MDQRSLLSFENSCQKVRPLLENLLHIMMSCCEQSDQLNISIGLLNKFKKSMFIFARSGGVFSEGEILRVAGHISETISAHFFQAAANPYELLLDWKELSVQGEKTELETYIDTAFADTSTQVPQSEELYARVLSQEETRAGADGEAREYKPMKIALVGPSKIDKMLIANYLCSQFNLKLISISDCFAGNEELLSGDVLSPAAISRLFETVSKEKQDTLLLDVPFSIEEAREIELSYGDKENDRSFFDKIIILRSDFKIDGGSLQFEVTRMLSENEELEKIFEYYRARRSAADHAPTGILVDSQSDTPTLLDCLSQIIHGIQEKHQAHIQKLAAEEEQRKSAAQELSQAIEQKRVEFEKNVVCPKAALDLWAEQVLKDIEEIPVPSFSRLRSQIRTALTASKESFVCLLQAVFTQLNRLDVEVQGILGRQLDRVAEYCAAPTHGGFFLKRFVDEYNQFLLEQPEIVNRNEVRAEWFLRLEETKARLAAAIDSKYTKLLFLKNQVMDTSQVLLIVRRALAVFLAAIDLQLAKAEFESFCLDVKLSSETLQPLRPPSWQRPSLDPLLEKVKAVKTVKEALAAVAALEQDIAGVVDALGKAPSPSDKNAKKNPKEKKEVAEESPQRKQLQAALLGVASANILHVKGQLGLFGRSLSAQLSQAQATIEQYLVCSHRRENEVLNSLVAELFPFIELSSPVSSIFDIHPFFYHVKRRPSETRPAPSREKERLHPSKLSLSVLLEAFHFLEMHQNYLGMAEQTRAIELFHLMKASSWYVPQKWAALPLARFLDFLELLDLEKTKLVPVNTFLLHLILADCKMITTQATNFYSEFLRTQPFFSREDFLETKLFFEIEDEGLFTDFETAAMKNLIFDVFANEKQQLDFRRLITSLTHLKRAISRQENFDRTYFELMF